MKIARETKISKVWHFYNLKQSHKIHTQQERERYVLQITKKHETIPIITWRESSYKPSKQYKKLQSGLGPLQAPQKSMGHEGAGLKGFGCCCWFFRAKNWVKMGDFKN